MKDLFGKSALILVLAALAACHAPDPEPRAKASVDRYDVGRMDLNPPPAVLSTQRHTGTFSKGSALSARRRGEAARSPIR